jgi:uncharacterized membrane protein
VPLLLFGIGLGGFFDGIVLHQILQWHHMISNTGKGSMRTVAGLVANTLGDGLFHASAFIVVLVAFTSRYERTSAVPSLDSTAAWRKPSMVGRASLGAHG